MRKIAIALIAPLLLPSVVHAWTPQLYTRMIGETLLERCRSSDPVYYYNDIGYCHGYISGVLDQMMYNRAAAGLDGCPLASNATEEQVWDVVINFLVANPTVALVRTVLRTGGHFFRHRSQQREFRRQSHGQALEHATSRSYIVFFS